jgi:hypothetical protein
MEEMQVDILPHQSYRELQLSEQIIYKKGP